MSGYVLWLVAFLLIDEMKQGRKMKICVEAIAVFIAVDCCREGATHRINVGSTTRKELLPVVKYSTNGTTIERISFFSFDGSFSRTGLFSMWREPVLN